MWKNNKGIERMKFTIHHHGHHHLFSTISLQLLFFSHEMIAAYLDIITVFFYAPTHY